MRIMDGLRTDDGSTRGDHLLEADDRIWLWQHKTDCLSKRCDTCNKVVHVYMAKSLFMTQVDRWTSLMSEIVRLSNVRKDNW